MLGRKYNIYNKTGRLKIMNNKNFYKKLKKMIDKIESEFEKYKADLEDDSDFYEACEKMYKYIEKCENDTDNT